MLRKSPSQLTTVKDQLREGLELKKQQNFLNELMKTNKIEYGK